MKSIFLSIIATLAIVLAASAQCNDKNIRTATKQGLESYIFENASAKNYNSFPEPRKTIDVVVSLFNDENYRIVNLCSGFDQNVEFTVFDINQKALFTGKGSDKFYDFRPRAAGDYTIRFNFKEVANPNACVAYAVGFKLD
jgi:hypothetical protein